jgi:hypothetical protein
MTAIHPFKAIALVWLVRFLMALQHRWTNSDKKFKARILVAFLGYVHMPHQNPLPLARYRVNNPIVTVLQREI